MKVNSLQYTLLRVLLGMIGAASPEPLHAYELEEIIITSQKREQSLQDASLAVTAVHADRISDSMLENAEDLQGLVPNVSVGNDFGQAKLFIRGIGLGSSFTGVDPSVALHLDGAVISQSFAQLGAFFDLERIEVLRGPQGTLYGRNATGGTFNLISRKPTEASEGYGHLTLGNYDKVLVEGALSGPLDDKLLGRIAFRTDNRSGYGENTVSGNDIDNAHKQSVRGQLLYNFGQDRKLLLAAEWHNEDDAALGLKYIRESFPDEPDLAPPGEGGFAISRRDVASEADYKNDRDTWSLSAVYEWQLDHRYRLKSIANYRDLDVLLRQDLDLSSNINDDIQTQITESKHFSEELQWQFSGEGLQGLAALYYFTEDLRGDNRIGFYPAFSDRQVVTLLGDINIEAWAVFANITIDLSPSMALKLGARYSYENREADNLAVLNFTALDVESFSDSRSFNDFSPTLGIEWYPTEEILLFLTYTEGFKSGTIQAGQLTPITEPEKIRNLEVGVKGDLWQDRLRISAVGFYYEFKDLQLSRTQALGSGAFATIFENAAETKAKGIEVEVSVALTERLRIHGLVGYLNAEFVDFETANPLDIDTNIQSLAGNRPRQAPEWSGQLRGEYERSLASGGRLILAGELSYKSEQFYTEFNDAITGEDAYTLVNANIKYWAPGDRLFVNLWGKNLTDELVYSGIFVIATGRSIAGAQLPPTTWGVTLGYQF